MTEETKQLSDISGSPRSSSESSSTAEEERLRRLFESCDADGDGFIDRIDFASMCTKLNMEDSVHEVMHQLGLGTDSRISFNDFIRCRSQVMDINDNEEDVSLPYMDDTGVESDIGIGTTKLTGNTAYNNISPWQTLSSNNSLGAQSGKPESVDYDSGARDLSPEPVTLQRLVESHDPLSCQWLQQNYSGCANFLELANRLHLAALTSLKGEIIELTNRLQHVSSERDILEKQLSKAHNDKLRLQREYEDRIEQTIARYEERITELHSVIAELRKKIERHRINVIQEEDEYEDSENALSAKSDNDVASLNENNANESQSASVDMGPDLNVELSRVVADLECAIDDRRNIEGDISSEHLADQAGADSDSVEEKAIQVCKEMSQLHFPSHPSPVISLAVNQPKVPPPDGYFIQTEIYQNEVTALRTENFSLQDCVNKQKGDITRLKISLDGSLDDNDKMKLKIRDLQHRLQCIESSSPLTSSRTSTPTKHPHITPSTGERSVSSGEHNPIAKVAELRRLKTSVSCGDRPILGAELTSLGLPNTKVAEHLVHTLQDCSNMQEIVQTFYKCGSEISDNKIREFEIETERLSSKIDNLKAQNDLLSLTLEESRSHADHLTVLIGKYESNNTALQLAINYSDQALEAYELLLALLETEQNIILANCRAAGLGSIAGDCERMSDQGEITHIIQRAHHSRKTAENVAKHLLHKLDRSCGVHMPGCSPQPWEDLSSNSRTTSTTSSTGSSSDVDFTKHDEQRLRDYIQQMKNDRAAVQMTVLELESIYLDPIVMSPSNNPDAQRLDLENAVLMQELMAMKEEKAELKAGNYLLERERRSLELRLSGKESQEEAYLVQIEHLKSEVKDQIQRVNKEYRNRKGDGSSPPPISCAELLSHDPQEVAYNYAETLKRERKLKQRIQELVTTLEKLSRNAEIRHQQSAEFVNDLKRANSALISAFEKAKKKYQSKLKKMEALSDRYESQIHLLKERLILVEEDRKRPPTNETSL